VISGHPGRWPDIGKLQSKVADRLSYLIVKGLNVQLLLGVLLAFKNLRNIKTPQRRFSPDKILTT
jgi:hypothetical protein